MIHLYCKTLVRFRCSCVLHSTVHKLYALQTHPLSSSLKSISTSTNQHSFTVNYLVNSCGLSPETAISASKEVNFKTLDKPDSFLNFFKNHDFSKTKISALIRVRPKLLLSDPKKTLLPKFEFFYSIGISSTELAKVLSISPIVLTRSLENQIIPSFNLLKNLFQSDDKFVTAFKRFPDILGSDHSAFPNIEILRQHGVPESNILYLLTYHPRSLAMKHDRFNELVEDVKKMGFNPSSFQFVLAVQALISMSKSTWKRKMEVYEKWGWSEEETMSAFRRTPGCMTVSEEMIMAKLNFYVNTMGWESSLIARRSELMTMSLESSFLKKFVTCYEEAPQLLKLYQEKLDASKLHGHNYEGNSGTYQL
ncbi:uncharacterized protein LOC132298649 [Cornus florida]|uniref:uncharacterized protein LOC132298649 n=1 Tax=Cornus florida TaxID=4283 RepID=UPI00289A802C|nr:uncharacterized protein LOC132298649 [Cornus florida]